MASILVRQVPASEAPKAIEARWDEGASPPEMHWRSFEGALWRPLVGPEGRALDASGSFESTAAHMTALRDDKSKPRLDWDDYPFLVSYPDSPYDRWESFKSWKEDSPEIRIRSSEKPQAVARAQARAADDLVLFDGVLHVRSAPPVWAVGSRGMPWIDPGRVRLAIPDLEKHGGWLASFPLDRRGDALEFARACVENVRAAERRGAPDVRDVFNDGAAAMYDAADFPCTRADDIRLAFEAVEKDLRCSELRQFSRGFLKAYGDLGLAVEALAPPGGEGPLARAEAAVDAVVGAADPDWERTWPNAATVVERLRTLSWRHEMEDRLAMLEDADAFAGPGL
jgi:hypothetical protein